MTYGIKCRRIIIKITAQSAVERRSPMIVTQEQAKALRRKKADLQLKNYEFASEIGVAPGTVPKILNGDYKAPKRIYASLMEWLAKDY